MCIRDSDARVSERGGQQAPNRGLRNTVSEISTRPRYAQRSRPADLMLPHIVPRPCAEVRFDYGIRHNDTLSQTRNARAQLIIVRQIFADGSEAADRLKFTASKRHGRAQRESARRKQPRDQYAR